MARFENGERVTKFRKEDVLKRLIKNRERHRKIFEAAQENFRKEVVTTLERRLEEAKEGKIFRSSFSLEEPRDMTSAYDSVIDMLTLSSDNEVEMTDREFNEYMRDQWSWKEGLLSNTYRYATTSNALVGDRLAALGYIGKQAVIQEVERRFE